jgi:hypothetical protein
MEEALYDLQADPYELVNLVGIDSYREVAEYLKRRLTARMQEAGEQAVPIRSAVPRSSGQRRTTIEELRIDRKKVSKM